LSTIECENAEVARQFPSDNYIIVRIRFQAGTNDRHLLNVDERLYARGYFNRKRNQFCRCEAEVSRFDRNM